MLFKKTNVQYNKFREIDIIKEKYYISVVDIVSVVYETKDGRKYLNKLKQRVKEEGNETMTNCHQLKNKLKSLQNVAI